jgi:protein SHQ1
MHLIYSLLLSVHQVVDVKDPDSKSLIERRNARLEQEEKEFNPEHYLADHFQTDYIEPLIDYKLPIPSADWTEAETNLLKNLPNKDFLLDPNLMQSTYLVFIFKMTIPYISNPYTDISFISFLEFG